MAGPKYLAPKVRIRQDLYDRVDAIADAGRKQGVSRTGIIEDAIEQYLANREKVATGTHGPTRRSAETEALLTWFHSPPTDLDEAIRNAIRIRLKELHMTKQRASNDGS